jgi:sugar phosphate isomerase/epimerase
MYRDALTENLRRLINLCAGRVIICIENSDLTPLARNSLQPHLDAKELALCWDVAKTYDRQHQLDKDMEHYFWSNVSHVRQVHLHDRRDGLSHRVIGTGYVDFLHFLPRLAGADVREYCIEVRPRDKALESLAYLRKAIRG